MDTHWFGEIPNPDKYYGFTYLIINTTNDRKYVGKKAYKIKRRRPPLKGRRRRRTYYGESNWKIYTGSSEELNRDIKRLGKDNFKFIILSQCKTKSGLYYQEVVELVLRHAVVLSEYYNYTIPAVRFKPKIDCTHEQSSDN